MAKKPGAISPQSSDLLLRDSRDYAIYVCENRAIPAIEDGMKFGQRIALWLLRNRAEKVKTYALSGLMGYERLYVHGETSANNAISLLAAPFKNNVPLIEGLGAFGSRIAPVEGIGAPRYTEVRRSEAAKAFFYNDLDLVPLEDNSDGSNVQPQHFLPLIPVVLLNGVSGVAVGWSTEILPRSLKSIVAACQDALAGKQPKVLEPFYNRYNIGVQSTGANQWEFTGKVDIVDTSTVRIVELPPGEKLDKFRARLIAMEDEESIVSFTDRSTDCIDITVKMKRGSIAKWSSADAIKFFKLTEKVTERIVLLNWGGTSIRTFSDPADLVTEYVEWRLGWYTKRYEKLRDDTLYECNYWKALAALFKDNFTVRLGKFANRVAVEEDVTAVTTKAKLVVDDKQLDRIVNLPTYRWTKAFEEEVKVRIAELEKEGAEYKAILASPTKLKAIYAAELDELKKLKV